MEPDVPDANVTIDVLPHTTSVVKDYCCDAEMDTDVSLSALPTSMGEIATTLTRKEWFDIGTTMLNVKYDDSLRPDHYGRRIMRKVHTEINR